MRDPPFSAVQDLQEETLLFFYLLFFIFLLLERNGVNLHGISGISIELEFFGHPVLEKIGRARKQLVIMLPCYKYIVSYLCKEIISGIDQYVV